MTDLVDDTRETPTTTLEAIALPEVFDPEEETTDVEECQYCGHFPCGCGG